MAKELTKEQAIELMENLQTRISRLEEENQALKSDLEAVKNPPKPEKKSGGFFDLFAVHEGGE